MLIMTLSSTILTGAEDKEEHRSLKDDTPTHSHRQGLNTPVDSVKAVEIKSDHENLERREHGSVTGVNLDEFFSCSADNRYSFYLGEKISPWGRSGPPLLKETRPNAPSPPLRRGRSVSRKQDMPPYMTTLDCNGRPRFQHRRVRSEGRLEIVSVAVDSSEMVSVRGRDGLRIGTVRTSQEVEDDDDDQRNH